MKTYNLAIIFILLCVFKELCGSVIPSKIQFSIVSDLDQDSNIGNGFFQSFFQKGTLSVKDGKFTVEMNEMNHLKSRFNDGRRGLELSDLVYFNGKLLSCDDRTGIVYEITSGRVIPRFVLANGDDSAFKCEWMSVRDDKLYIGAYGREYTENEKIRDYNYQWVKVIDSEGRLEHVFWRSCYEKLREHTGTLYPGYLLHEAVEYNPQTKEWFFLPRRASKERYDPAFEENRGTNLVLIANEDCTSIRSSISGSLNITRGVSSFKFIDYEGTAIILKTYESNDGKTESFLSVSNLNSGIVLMEEISLGFVKFEGIAIDNIEL